MIGASAQEDKQMLRQAQSAKCVNLLYEDAFRDWQKKRHGQLLDKAGTRWRARSSVPSECRELRQSSSVV